MVGENVLQRRFNTNFFIIALVNAVLVGLTLYSCTQIENETKPISLDGQWGFTYRDTFTGEIPQLPTRDAFVTELPVPAFWDDHRISLEKSLHQSHLTYFSGASPVDFSTVEKERQGYRTMPLSYIQGLGYYQKQFELSPSEVKQTVFLEFAEVSQEAWVWVNDNYVGHQLGHGLPFNFDISHLVNASGTNDLVVAVSNLTDYAGGFALSGYKGRSGGLTGSVELRITDEQQIRDCYVYTNTEQDSLFWQVEMAGDALGNSTLVLQIFDPMSQTLVSSDTVSATISQINWSSTTPDLIPWSDVNPRQYEVQVELWSADRMLDQRSQGFGLRRLTRQGRELFLNGNPIFLRGVTDHCYWAETLTSPRDKLYYTKIISRLQEVGFNWIRFHTWVPDEAYLEAADDLGMLMMVELPEGFGLEQWNQALTLCRSHPSVVLYSGGNEQHMNEAKIEYLAQVAQLQKSLAPDALFNPQEALRGVEYWWRISDLGTDTTHTPFIHNPVRLERLKEFSDVFGQYGWGYLSYWSEWGDPEFLDERLVVYERPCLSHEIGIKGNYIDLSHTERMQKTKIGADRYLSAKQNLVDAGLLDRAETYYKNSVAWLHTFRKQTVETVRRSKYYQGYDFLGGHDHNQVGGGYEAGFLNEFFEYKPGDKAEDFLRYNAATVLLLDVGPERIFKTNEQLSFALKLSHWGSEAIKDGQVEWRLTGTAGKAYATGSIPIAVFQTGQLGLIDSLKFQMPDLTKPEQLSLVVSLVDASHFIQNDWNFWVFPKTYPEQTAEHDVDYLLTTEMDEQVLKALSEGETVVLLGTDVFPSHSLDYTIGLAGRTHGNLATVITEHPIMSDFPHEGWCNWQFRPLFSDTSNIIFNDIDLPFEPIIEVVSSYKYIIKQSVLFELQVGQGRLIVATLNFQDGEVAGDYLLSNILNYAAQPELWVSAPEVHLETIEMLLINAGRMIDVSGTVNEASENQRGNLDDSN